MRVEDEQRRGETQTRQEISREANGLMVRLRVDVWQYRYRHGAATAEYNCTSVGRGLYGSKWSAAVVP